MEAQFNQDEYLQNLYTNLYLHSANPHYSFTDKNKLIMNEIMEIKIQNKHFDTPQSLKEHLSHVTNIEIKYIDFLLDFSKNELNYVQLNLSEIQHDKYQELYYEDDFNDQIEKDTPVWMQTANLFTSIFGTTCKNPEIPKINLPEQANQRLLEVNEIMNSFLVIFQIVLLMSLVIEITLFNILDYIFISKII